MSTTIDDGGVLVDTLRGQEAAMRQTMRTHDLQLAQIDATYGESLPYDYTRLINECRWHLGNAAQSLLEAGKRLIVLKEHESHGSFVAALDAIGIARGTAARAMKAAVKYSGGARALLVDKLDRSKLIELMVEDDEDLDALAEGGTVAGLTLDVVDRMSARELRGALRKSREERTELQQLQDRLLADKDAKINDLHKRLMKAEQRSLLGDQQAELDAAEVGRDIALSTQRVLDALFGVERLVLALSERELPVHLGEALAGNLQRITDHLDRVREIGAAVIPDDGGPDDAGWINELPDDGRGAA